MLYQSLAVTPLNLLQASRPCPAHAPCSRWRQLPLFVTRASGWRPARRHQGAAFVWALGWAQHWPHSTACGLAVPARGAGCAGSGGRPAGADCRPGSSRGDARGWPARAGAASHWVWPATPRVSPPPPHVDPNAAPERSVARRRHRQLEHRGRAGRVRHVRGGAAAVAGIDAHRRGGQRVVGSRRWTRRPLPCPGWWQSATRRTAGSPPPATRGRAAARPTICCSSIPTRGWSEATLSSVVAFMQAPAQARRRHLRHPAGRRTRPALDGGGALSDAAHARRRSHWAVAVWACCSAPPPDRGRMPAHPGRRPGDRRVLPDPPIAVRVPWRIRRTLLRLLRRSRPVASRPAGRVAIRVLRRAPRRSTTAGCRATGAGGAPLLFAAEPAALRRQALSALGSWAVRVLTFGVERPDPPAARTGPSAAMAPRPPRPIAACALSPALPTGGGRRALQRQA